MIKVFISQPMRDKTDEQIKAERKRALDEIKALYPNEEIEEIKSFFEGAPHDATPLWFFRRKYQIVRSSGHCLFLQGLGKVSRMLYRT